MTNKLVRSGSFYTVPAVPYQPYRPAYTVVDSYPTTTYTLNTTGGVWGYYSGTGASGGSSQYANREPGTPIFYPTWEIKQGTKYTTFVYHFPAQPEVLGSPARRVNIPPEGWTSFAHSIASVFGSGEATYNVGDQIVGAVVGFSNTPNPVAGYGHITHGLLFTGRKVQLLRTAANLGAYAVTDEFKMRVQDGVVSYFKNDVELTTEASTYLPQDLYLSAAFYAPSDFIDNPALVPLYGGSSVGVLPALRTMAAEDTYAESRAFWPTWTVAAGILSKGAFTLPAFRVLATDRFAYAAADVEVPAFSAFAYGGAIGVERNNTSETQMPRFYASGILLVGGLATGDSTLPAFTTMGADRPYAEAMVTLPAFQALGYTEPPDQAFMFEVMSVAHPLAASTELVAVMLDGVLATATFTASELLDALMQELITVTPRWATSAFLDAVMYSFVHSGATFAIPGVGAETWAFNTGSGGSSSYSNFDFNSYAKIGDKFYGASPGGIAELDGDSDDGAPIRAVIGLGQRDFGSAMRKTVSHAYIGMSATGNLFVKLIAEGAEYIYKTRDFSEEMQQQRVTFGKGLRTNYVWLDIYNEDGADFEIDTVEFHVADLSRRI